MAYTLENNWNVTRIMLDTNNGGSRSTAVDAIYGTYVLKDVVLQATGAEESYAIRWGGNVRVYNSRIEAPINNTTALIANSEIVGVIPPTVKTVNCFNENFTRIADK